MVEIPVIDLGVAGELVSAEMERLRDACCGGGCFRLAGHGVPAELRAEMKAAVRSLFDLPAEAKRRNADVIAGSGYVGPTKENPLYEAFGLYDAAFAADVDAFCAHLDAPPQTREIIKNYVLKLHELIADVASKVVESLGLKGYSFMDWPCQLRMNKYNFTEESVGSSGVQIHTDSGFLTLLQEDDCVGGLEVMDATGAFMPVDPLPGSFLVNLGDVAKAWSNAALHNVKHRVQCIAAIPRISFAMFLLAPKDDKVCAPEELVDAEHPRLFQTFNFHDYRNLRLSAGLRAGEALAKLAA